MEKSLSLEETLSQSLRESIVIFGDNLPEEIFVENSPFLLSKTLLMYEFCGA